ncbi:UNVERIFIED_CONTAM: hypothetical protein GTU68_034681 [Idotea baltica]|nr:hypothetical protein [Idotea baltica]
MSILPKVGWLSYIEASLNGGVQWVQYRNKAYKKTGKFDDLYALKTLCDRYSAHLIINDNILLASHLDVGLHLGQTDTSLAQAKDQISSKRLVGITCHNQIPLAIEACKNKASYVSFGRFFPSKTKPEAPPADLSILSEAKLFCACPVIAIGGITLANAQKIIDHGADVLAIADSLYSTHSLHEVEHNASRFHRLFT